MCLALAALYGACEPAAESPDAGAARETESPPRPQHPGKKERPQETPTPASPSPSPMPEGPGTVEGYAPNAHLPDTPAGLADALEKVHSDLARDIRGWLTAGGALDTRRARHIELAALFQQRIYRKLVRDPGLARRVLTRFGGSLKQTARTNVAAGHRLSADLAPVKPPVRLRTAEPAPPRKLLAFYDLAERRFGVPSTVLASVNFVETRFGRVLGPSSAGALGPMQFLPSTWERYGAGGDILDPHDAILGAARYLRASGALTDIRSALYAYNRSDDYVDSVLDYANEMERRPNAFYEYYFWQVFVRTTKGDVQLTGPGADPTP